jgi:replicative DNA helicase
MDIETSIPRDLAAEIAIIGAMIVEPAIIDEVADVITTDAMFHDDRHRVLFAAITAMHHKSQLIDILTVKNALANAKLLEAAGGMDYLITVVESFSSSASAVHYAAIVREKWQLRSMMQACSNGLRESRDGTVPAAEIIDAHHATIAKIAEAAAISSTVQVADRVPEVLRMLHGEADESAYGLKTGLPTVDEMIHGMKPGEVILLGSHTNHGKTALALNVASHVAIQQQAPVAIVSLEMTHDEVTERLLLAQSGLPKDSICGKLTRQQQSQLRDATDRLLAAKIIVDDAGDQTIQRIRAKGRMWKRKYGTSLLVIDYVQLLHGENRRDQRRDQLVEISRGIKLLAKELGMPILALSQLNRESAKDDRLPNNWDLAECAAFERDANVILLLDREYCRKRNNNEWLKLGKPFDAATLQVSKNRGGELGTVDLKFKAYCVRFQEAIEAVAEQGSPQQGLRYDLAERKGDS